MQKCQYFNKINKPQLSGLFNLIQKYELWMARRLETEAWNDARKPLKNRHSSDLLGASGWSDWVSHRRIASGNFFLTVTILNNNYHHENWPMMEMLIPLSSVVFSLIWTIPSSVIIGIPIHYILSKMGVRNYFSYGTASFFAAYFLLSYLFTFSPSFPSDLSMKLTLSAIFGIPTGVAFRALNRGDSTKEPNF